jgi:hypothetical protein
MTDATELPFDAVVVRGDNGEQQLDVEAFLAMPLARRIQMILQRRLEFLSNGDAVDLGAALRTLRTLRSGEQGSRG